MPDTALLHLGAHQAPSIVALRCPKAQFSCHSIKAASHLSSEKHLYGIQVSGVRLHKPQEKQVRSDCQETGEDRQPSYFYTRSATISFSLH